MSKHKELRIGLIGGGFMGRTHSNGYRRVPNFFPALIYTPALKAVCFRNETKLKAFAEQWGYESIETDWKALIKRPDIDAIDICTPNDTHAEIAMAAAEVSVGLALVLQLYHHFKSLDADLLSEMRG